MKNSIREEKIIVVNEGDPVFFLSLCRRSRSDYLIRTNTRLVNRWDGWKGIRVPAPGPCNPTPGCQLVSLRADRQPGTGSCDRAFRL